MQYQIYSRLDLEIWIGNIATRYTSIFYLFDLYPKVVYFKFEIFEIWIES